MIVAATVGAVAPPMHAAQRSSSSLGLIAAVGPRVRISPFFSRTVAAGLTSVSTYNHMWLPMSYGDPDGEYRRLTTGVTLWDVAAQRHIAVRGPDADAVAQMMTVIDVTRVEVGAAAHAPMVDHDGRLINDPILLHVAPSEWRFSIADRDVRPDRSDGPCTRPGLQRQ